MKNAELDKNDIIKETEIKSENETWIIIGGEKKWVRKCPTCDIKIKYTRIENRNTSEKKKTQCKSCQNKSSRKHETPDILKRNCPVCDILIVYNGKNLSIKRNCYLRAIKENRLCKSCNGKLNNSMAGSCRMGKDNPNYGKQWNQKQKKKARLNTIKDLSLKGITFGYKGANNFNPKACEYFDKLNKENNWNLQHALNGGEYFISNLGYWIDGYDKSKNIVVEYDERHHYINNKLKNKDVDRMNEIIKYLHCKFYRYNEKQKILMEII